MTADTMSRESILTEAFHRYPMASKRKVRRFAKMRALTSKCLARLRHEARSGMSDQTGTAIIYVIHRNNRLLG
jgi:hypothetical protein